MSGVPSRSINDYLRSRSLGHYGNVVCCSSRLITMMAADGEKLRTIGVSPHSPDDALICATRTPIQI